MKRLKRILSLILIMSMVIAPSVAATETTNTDTALYEDIAQKLAALEIVDLTDALVGLDEQVIRVDFACVLARIAGGADEGNGTLENDLFLDVTRDYWAASQINTAVSFGFMKGYKDGKFYPEEEVKMSEAIVTLVEMTGWDVKANYQGGDLAAYIRVATSIGLLDGVDLNGAFDKKTMYVLINNLLDIDILEMKSAGIEADYVTAENFTVLSAYRDIYKHKGVVTSTGISTLTAPVLSDENRITVDDIVYQSDGLAVSDLLGYQVECYYQIVNDRNVMLYIQKTDRNNAIDIDAKNIIAGSTTIDTFAYYDGNRQRTIAMSDGIKVVFNGIAKPDYSKANITPTSGNVTFVDNNDDNIYDIVHVFSVTNYGVVNSVGKSGASYAVQDKINNSNTITLKTENDIPCYRIIKGNEEILPSSLKSGDVLLVGENTDHGFSLVYVAETPAFEGKIATISTDFVYIDGISYEKSTEFKTIVNNKLIIEPKPGDNGVAYIDSNGRIMAFIKGAVLELQYAMLLNAATKTEAFTEEGKIQILDIAGEIKTFDLAEKVKLNGETKKAKVCIDKLLAANVLDKGRDAASNRQLIRFKTNSKGLVTELRTVTSTTDGEYKLTDELTYTDEVSISGVANNDECPHLGSKYIIPPGNILVFYMYTKDKECLVQDKLTVKSGAATAHFYDLQESQVPGAIVINISASAAGRKTVSVMKPFTIVTGTGEVMDEDGVVEKCIFGKTKGEDDTIFFNSDLDEGTKKDFENVKPGDLIVYEKTDKGTLTELFILYEAAKKGQYGEMADDQAFSFNTQTDGSKTSKTVHGQMSFGNQTYNRRIIYGRAEKKVDNVLIYSLGTTERYARRLKGLYNPIRYYIVETSARGDVSVDSTAAFDSILPGDDVVICASGGLNLVSAVFIMR